MCVCEASNCEGKGPMVLRIFSLGWRGEYLSWQGCVLCSWCRSYSSARLSTALMETPETFSTEKSLIIARKESIIASAEMPRSYVTGLQHHISRLLTPFSGAPQLRRTCVIACAWFLAQRYASQGRSVLQYQSTNQASYTIPAAHSRGGR